MGTKAETGRHVDVLIIGAGISGIGSAYHLQENCPGKTYAIVESRKAIGGTWDLFRYPGIRSDSDMYTFGFKFKPWISPKAISPGEDIRHYLTEAAAENGIDQHIQFGRRVVSASWSSANTRWTVQVRELASGSVQEITCHFLFSCGGYYNYEAGYTPEFQGVESFKGMVVHPQHWPQELDYSGKKVIVVGSGATAVTLVPAMAKTAASVTMLQRSPTYIVSRPEQDAFANALRRYLPLKLAYSITRWKNVLWGMYTYRLAKRKPELVKRFLVDEIKKYLGPDYDVDKHFVPAYKPWDQRICLVPDGDFFKAIKHGCVDVVTDHIDRFTQTGILLQSGEELTADIIVTATGLRAELFSGMQLAVDGKVVEIEKAFTYKGMMLSGLPNFALSMGYANASWTLKSDLVGEYVCRLLNYMYKHNLRMCVPTMPPEGVEAESMMQLTSGYVLRARDSMPQQGLRKPWKLYQNYILDKLSLELGPVTDSCMKFSNPPVP